MSVTRTWHVEVFLYEDGDHTRADAVLRTDAGTELRASGLARRNPGDREVAEIGDELSTSRAFADLAHQLLEAATSDVEQNIGGPVSFTE